MRVQVLLSRIGEIEKELDLLNVQASEKDYDKAVDLSLELDTIEKELTEMLEESEEKTYVH